MSKEHSADSAGSASTASGLDFPVVGIGASAGGLAALTRFFEQMPAESGMAFVVVLHLSPSHDSSVDAILQRTTRMPVRQVEGRIAIEPDHVYVIPPSKLLLVEDGHLRLDELTRPYGGHLAIDLFFRSLALAHRERAVAVVLSGTGSDGSEGLRRIKECGGVALAQSPGDAEYDMMPLSAMATGMADFVLSAADMPDKLVALWQNAQHIELPDPPEDLHVLETNRQRDRQQAEQAFHDVVALLAERTGQDFRHYKRATVLRRLERRMQVTRQPTLPSYRAYLQANLDETPRLLQDMLISVTNFYRDREAFDALERTTFADLAESKTPPNQLRAWVAGCATGEEAYSVAILLIEQAMAMKPVLTVQVFGSDVDERAIAVGRAGVYPEAIVADVPPVRLRQFFHHEPDSYRIGKLVRERVTFSMHNVLRDPPFSRMNLVSCRNLLIYLDREAQRRVLETFHYALLPGGLLFLGTSETADAAPELFVAIDKKSRIYRRLGESRARHLLPTGMSAELRVLGKRPDAPAPGREKLLADIHQQLMDEYAPPSVMVDEAHKIVHLSGGTARFVILQARTGEWLPDAVLPQLRATLTEALAMAKASDQSVEAERVRVEGPTRPWFVNMLVRPLRHPQAGPGWALVIFVAAEAEEMALGADADDAQPDAEPGADGELRQTRAQLLRSMGDSAISAEELRAANEELQSLNEELRSATEELETSKEELQSVNEELTTVNYELRSKVDETAKANDDLTNLIAANDIATVFVDAQLRIKRYTPRAASVFNILQGDIGRPLLDITHRLDYPRLGEDAREAFIRLQTIEREVRSDDGRWYLARLLPYRTLENRIDGAVLNFIDITGRREAEERLRAGEARLNLVAESTRDFAIITMDGEGMITGWNRGAEQMFGYSEAQAQGQHASLIFTPEDQRQGVPEDELRRAREQGRAQDERWHARKDGVLIYCSGVMTLLPSVGTEVEGYAKIARDLTETKRVQEQREALLHSEQLLRVQLEAANRQKDEFLAVMSHELKNPLNLIALNAELLQRLPESRGVPSVVRIAQTVRSTVDSQAKIINDLLDLSRIQTGKLSLSRSLVAWDEVVHRITDAVRRDAEAKGLNLVLQVEPGDYRVYADPVRLEQVVWNLLSNALKFTPPGGSIRVQLVARGEEIALTVSDTGRGIEPAFLNQLFDMFSQADSSVARREGGLGIGLAVTKRLVELHGGRIEAQSEGADRGASFTVVLDRAGPALVAANSPSQVSSALGGLRLLMVDDEPDTLQTFSALLEMEGADMTVADSGAEALRLSGAGQFDLLVSDLAMPGMDGYSLLSQLREAGHQMPAIAVSGMGRASDRKRAMEAGFAELVSKPVDLSTLLNVIATVRKR